MGWYIAKFKDKGAGRTGQQFFIEGRTEYSAQENAKKHADNDMDPESVSLTPVDKTEDDVKYSVFMSGGPNTAYTSEGEQFVRSEIDVDELDVERQSYMK